MSARSDDIMPESPTLTEDYSARFVIETHPRARAAGAPGRDGRPDPQGPRLSDVIANLLGEACVLATIVGASLKFEGRLILAGARVRRGALCRGRLRHPRRPARFLPLRRRRTGRLAGRQCRQLPEPGSAGAAGQGHLHHDARSGRPRRALPGHHADRGREPGPVRRALFRPNPNRCRPRSSWRSAMCLARTDGAGAPPAP